VQPSASGDPAPRLGVYGETIIDPSALEAIRAGLRGTAYTPGEDGYHEGRQAFNLDAHQHEQGATFCLKHKPFGYN
jgi:hypothetical protein